VIFESKFGRENSYSIYSNVREFPSDLDRDIPWRNIGVPHLDRDILVSILASTPAWRLIHQSISSARWSYLPAFFTLSLSWKLTWIHTMHDITNWQTWLNLPRGRKNVPARCPKIDTARKPYWLYRHKHQPKPTAKRTLDNIMTPNKKYLHSTFTPTGFV
jgi:hypothetical protein